jgi:hypothetical protein
VIGSADAVVDALALRQRHHTLWSHAGWRPSRAGSAVDVLLRPGAPAAVRTSVQVGMPADALFQFLVVDMLDTITTWSPSISGGRIVKYLDDSCRHIATRTRMPWPCADREDSYWQHTRIDDDGTLWELSVDAPDAPPPPPGCVRGHVVFSSKRIVSEDGGAHLDVLWLYAMGGFLGRLPPSLFARPLADALAKERGHIEGLAGLPPPHRA